VPFPLPLGVPVTVIHDAPLVAVHAHPAAADMANDPVVAPDVTDRLVGVIE
jgi:hypothetical protein